MGRMDEQTLTFRDGSEQWNTSFIGKHDTTRDVTVLGDISLSDFFMRPIKIANYAWDPAAVTPFYQAFDPWTLFMTNPRVSNRISNYKLFSGKCHVKFMINGNQFYYGRLMVHYTPLPSQDSISDWSPTSIYPLVQASQGLHAYVDPCLSQGCELELPFVWNYDMIDLTLGEQNKLGNIYVREMQALKHANAATDPITIQVFAWLTDVKLSVPTVNEPTFLTPQAGKFNEYSTSPVSTIASATASVMGKLSTVPIIGAYAKASEMVLSGVAGLARLFGYSRPAMIQDYVDMRPNIVSRLAVTNAGDNVAKLTVDSKQEVTIDPGVVGIGKEDELVLTSIASKESYLTNFTWTTGAAAGATLFSIRVAPIWNVSGNKLYFPAVTYASIPFRYWHGTMKYRFQIVASAFHRGRLLIVWDPISQSVAPESNVQYSKIIDLSNERDFTFEVGWGAAQRWLVRPTLSTTTYFSTALAYPTADTSFNGVVSVYVLNDLSTPNSAANNDIGINVFISGCEDMEFAVPDSLNMCRLTTIPSLSPQAGTFDETIMLTDNAPVVEESAEIIADCLPKDDQSALVYMGERITSFRQMMKRYQLWMTLYDPTATGAYTVVTMPDFPGARGYDAAGAYLNGANYYNPSLNTTLNYLSFAYLAFRGGVRRKYVIGSTANGNTFASVNRLADSNVVVSPALASVARIVTTALNFSRQMVNIMKPALYDGAHVTSIVQQPSVEVELPFYNNARFVAPRLQALAGARTSFAANYLAHTLVYDHGSSASSVDIYVAAADDATFIGFQGCCPLQLNTNV